MCLVTACVVVRCAQVCVVRCVVTRARVHVLLCVHVDV